MSSSANEINDWVDRPVPARPFQFRLRRLIAGVTLIAVALSLIVLAYRASRDAADRMECSNHLKHIALALQNYHDTYQSFPAAYQINGAGQIAHSWRVAIWPFMMSDPTCDLYDYNEPWNGPNNSRLQGRVAYVYRCPGDHNHKHGMTNYVAVVGPGTAWPGTSYMGASDLTDGTEETIMVVEIANSDIHWMEPRDLPVEELKELLDPSHKPTLMCSHAQGRIKDGLVVFADGHTEFLSHDVTEKRLRALLSPAGNDIADVDDDSAEN